MLTTQAVRAPTQLASMTQRAVIGAQGSRTARCARTFGRGRAPASLSAVLCKWRITAALFLVSATVAHADEANAYLAQAKVLYRALEYPRCVQRLERARETDTTPAELVELELYDGLCRFAMGDKVAAAERFKLALRLKPDVELPALSSPKLVEFFEALRAKLPPADAPTADSSVPSRPPPPPDTTRRLDAVEPAAPQAPPAGVDIAPRPSPSRRRWPLAGGLGAGAFASAAAAIGFGLAARAAEYEANTSAPSYELAQAAAGRAHTFAIVTNVAWGIAGAAALAAIVALILPASDSP